MTQDALRTRSATARRGICRLVLAALAIPIALAPAAACAAQAMSDTDADAGMARRLGEYEALLGEPLAQEDALCLDALLADRWPEAALPSDRQWQRMLAQARQAMESCIASSAADQPRAAAALRRAMALQVERQRALAALRARMRACLAQAPGNAACDALRREGALTPEQERRLRAAAGKGGA